MKRADRNRLYVGLAALGWLTFEAFNFYRAATTGEIEGRSERLWDVSEQPLGFWWSVAVHSVMTLIATAVLVMVAFPRLFDRSFQRYFRARELPLDNARRASLDPEA